MSGPAAYRDVPFDVLRQGGRPGGAGGNGGGGGALIAPQQVVFPPEVYPIPGATLFSVSTVPPGLAVSAAGGGVVLVTIPIPAQSVGVINVVEYGANTVTTATLLLFALRFNQGPVSYGPLTISPSRNATFAGESRNPLIRVPLGTTVVDIFVTVGAADGATYLCGATVEGWYWTLAQAQAYASGVVS